MQLIPSFLILRGVTVSFAFSARLHDFRVRQILSCAADELSVPLENFPMLLRICVNAGHVGALFFSMFCGMPLPFFVLRVSHVGSPSGSPLLRVRERAHLARTHVPVASTVGVELSNRRCFEALAAHLALIDHAIFF